MTSYKIGAMAELEPAMRTVALGEHSASAHGAVPSVASAELLLQLQTPKKRVVRKTDHDQRSR